VTQGYDNDRLSACPLNQGIKCVVPCRQGHKRPTSPDGRLLCRYRWNIERMWAWLFNFFRISVRYKHYEHNDLSFISLDCILILARGCAMTSRSIMESNCMKSLAYFSDRFYHEAWYYVPNEIDNSFPVFEYYSNLSVIVYSTDNFQCRFVF